MKSIPTGMKYEDIMENILQNHSEEELTFPQKDCYFSLSDLALSHSKKTNQSDGKGGLEN